MTAIERTFYAVTAAAVWILLLGDLVALPGAQAQSTRTPDRLMSEVMHEIVTRAAKGETLQDSGGYDALEARLQAVMTRVVQELPRSEAGASSQDIRQVLNGCRLIGSVAGQAGRLDARLSC